MKTDKLLRVLTKDTPNRSGRALPLPKYQGTQQSQTGYQWSPGAVASNQAPTTPMPEWGLTGNYVANLPKEGVLIQNPDGTTRTVTRGEYDQLSPNLAKVGDQGQLIEDLSAIEIPGYNYQGCVQGVCYDYANATGTPLEEFRKRNNVYGDAWQVLSNSFGSKIDYNPKDFSNLKVNDLINLTRKSFASDKEKGIPSENQHVGRISKIVDGVPYVKHYITSEGRYYEEPINDIKSFTKYTPTGVKRLEDFKPLNLQPSTFTFDKNYRPNQIEEQFWDATREKPKIQEALRLDNDEYNDLEKLAYGIMHNESGFGRSEKTLYRMAVPDFIQKLVKVGNDFIRDKDVYDENINNLSQGYGSLKESTLHGVNQTDIKPDKSNKLTTKEINDKIKSGDFSGLERTNNYLYTVMQGMGLNPDNLENGGNSFKALMATLAFLKKRFPNATDDELLQKYTGKKNISKYKANMQNAFRNIDQNPENNLEYNFMDDVYGTLSSVANDVNAGLKDIRSSAVSAARDYAPGPLMVRALASDMLGGKDPITESTLSSSQLDALREIVRNQVNAGNLSLDYNAYFPNLTRSERLAVSGGKDAQSITETLKRALSAEGQLQNTFGQATIVPLGNGKYAVQDTYDFNDQGKSFGLMDDLIKRGVSPYAISRSLGRNYGSADEQGAPVNVMIDLNEKEYGGVSQEKAKEILRDGSVHGHPLTEKQKGYFGWIAGGKKQDGGLLQEYQGTTGSSQTGLSEVIVKDLPLVEIVGQKPEDYSRLNTQGIQTLVKELLATKNLNDRLEQDQQNTWAKRDKTQVGSTPVFAPTVKGHTPYAVSGMEGALGAADVLSDIMQYGYFVPHPTGQAIGAVGSGLGSIIDSYQAGQDYARGDYGSMAANLASAGLSGLIASQGYTRDMWNTVPGSTANKIASLGSRSGKYRPLTTYPHLQNNPVIRRGLNYNRGALGALGAETVYDISQQKLGGPTKTLKVRIKKPK